MVDEKLFSFEFTGEHRGFESCSYQFRVSNIPDLWDNGGFTEHDEFFEFLSEMEDYGVHDLGYSPDTEIVGFCSYEIEETNIPIVMENWREYFISLGFTCGPIEKVVNANTDA
jgi:hypothetical protein